MSLNAARPGIAPGHREKKALQAAVALACLVPLGAGAAGVVLGAAMLGGAMVDGRGADMDSHFRYLSGLLLGIGLAFAALIPGIERHGRTFRLLAAIVALGGLARLGAALFVAAPFTGMTMALVMELVVTPALALWQARVARRQ